ncbi:LTA synthase family protein [Shewanella xiamenensis]|uniref:LTA synthase family protein n=1 Tax=Shewanella xiamenensis TaxID=332186 RepID=UPI0035B86E60
MALNKFRSIFFIYLSILGVLTLYRITSYIVYSDYYEGWINLSAIVLDALRFDLMTASYVMLVPSLLILIPHIGRRTGIINNVGLTLSIVMWLLTTLALIGDFIYFGVVNRHTFNDLPLLMAEASFVLPFILHEHFSLALFFFLFTFAFLFGFYKNRNFFYIKESQVNSVYFQLVIFLISLPILLVCLRGFNISGKALGMIDAYSSQNERHANLVLNGLYTGAKGTLQSVTRSDYHYFSDKEVGERFNRPEADVYNYPFLTRFPENTTNGRNLVIILVEALSYEYIDGLSGSNYKVTPFLDDLSKKSEVYDSFYAVAQRSNLGVQASLFGIPPLESVGYIGGGLELSRLTKIGNIAQSHGYQTHMLQSSKRDSIRLDSIANYAGFQQYLGKSDIPITRKDYPDPEGAQFGWDYEMLMKTLELANKSNKPFISFSFTGTTHMPYVETPKHLQVYPYGQDKFTDFLNTIRYTDDALKSFFSEAEKQPWFNNTTFMILADHTLFNSKNPSLKSAFHIPLWIYRPGQNIAPKRHTMLASQLDILPTAFDLLGFNDEFSSVGRSLYRERKPYSIVVKGELAGAFTNDGGFLIIGDKLLVDADDENFTEKQASKYVDQLKLELQLAQQALLNNTWAK